MCVYRPSIIIGNGTFLSPGPRIRLFEVMSAGACTGVNGRYARARTTAVCYVCAHARRYTPAKQCHVCCENFKEKIRCINFLWGEVEFLVVMGGRIDYL